MHCLTLTIVPTAGLTFRILPGSIVHIATYPFVPPTTLSGFLRRLVALSAGVLPPTTAGHGAKDSPPFWALPREFVCCGAYPEHGGYSVHSTARLGPESLAHTLAGRLRSEKDRENPQLHTWEYLITDHLTGYVVHKDESALQSLLGRVSGYGCKLGKEGFGYVEDGRVVPLRKLRDTVAPSALVPVTELGTAAADVFPVYSFAWDDKAEVSDPFDEASPILGYRRFAAGLTDRDVETEYWADDAGRIRVPVSLVEVLT